METLSEQFEDAVSNVTVSGRKRDAAIAAHQEVQMILEGDTQLAAWGIDAILIGSYARLTARYPGKDVDVFLRLTGLTTGADPSEVYGAVEKALVAQYGLKEEGGRVTKQARSLNVEFGPPADRSHDGFSIDAVPAVPWDANWGIPNRQTDRWDDPDERWIETNPIQFADHTNTLATASWSPVVDKRNAYRPIVRLLRQIRYVHLDDARPGGLYTEVVAYYAWKNREVAGTSWAELLAASLHKVADGFSDAAHDGLTDPVLGTGMKPELEVSEWVSAETTFRALGDKADEALRSDKCLAAKIWRDILGENDRGHVLPLPAGCDANGFAIGSVAAVASAGSDDARGFAYRLAHGI